MFAQKLDFQIQPDNTVFLYERDYKILLKLIEFVKEALSIIDELQKGCKMDKEKLCKMIGEEVYNRLEPEDIEFMLNTAGAIDFGIIDEDDIHDVKAHVADVYVQLFSDYNPTPYRDVIPYHERDFYCLREPKTGFVYKIASHLIEEIREEWHGQ